jgi:hypothetical protein
MTIDYILESRRSRQPDTDLAEMYRRMYGTLKLLLPVATYPELIVSYSMKRGCENIKIRGTNYLIYDQYLGQSFARLNRILFAATDAHQELVFSYAFKFLAEKHIAFGRLHRALTFAVSHRMLLEEVRKLGDPFTMPEEDERSRHSFTVCQEYFVLAHELSHASFALAGPLDRSLIEEEYRKIRHWIEQSFFTDRNFDDLMTDSQLEAAEVLRQRVEGLGGNESLRARYLEILDASKDGLIREVLCDRLACDMAFRVLREVEGVEVLRIATAVALSFRYLRLFTHLENLAVALDQDAARLRALNKGERERELQRLVVTGDSNVATVGFQIREKLLRLQLFREAIAISARQKGDLSPKEVEEIRAGHRSIEHLLMRYGETVEDEVTHFLPLSISAGFDLIASADTDGEADMLDKKLLARVEFVLGWRSTKPGAEGLIGSNFFARTLGKLVRRSR